MPAASSLHAYCAQSTLWNCLVPGFVPSKSGLYISRLKLMACWLLLLIANVWSLSNLAAATEDVAAAMAVDDECGHDAPCSLNALQVQTERTDGLEEPTRCDNSSACADNRTCVFKPDRSWSQCVPLDDGTFQKECRYWDRGLRDEAIIATGIRCNSVQCEYDQDCPLSTVCVSKPDDSWAQCVPLTKKEFQTACVKWEDDFRLAGIRATGFNCPNSRCYSQDWCVRGARCALQSDGKWGQCISCHDDSTLA